MGADGNLISDATAGRMKQVFNRVLGTSHPIARQRGRRPVTERRYEGILTTGRGTPTDGWSSPSFCMFQPYTMDPDNQPYGMIPDPNMEPFQVLIRDPTLAAAANIYCKVEFINGFWSIYWLGCL
jgi:hypothetical protein